MASSTINILSFDIEEWFHPEIFAGRYPRESWDRLEARVQKNTELILNFLSRKRLKATLFFMGWVAEKYPDLVRAAVQEGHEIASHGYAHVMINKFATREDFRADLRQSIQILSELAGEPVIGFRAPTFSVTKKTLWALPIMFEEGIRYDSSVFPILHDRYGIPDAPREPYMIFRQGQEGITEYPMTTVRVGKFNLPLGGGGYLRLYPFKFSLMLMKRCATEGRPIMFYAHPWEFDVDAPRVDLGWVGKIRHYHAIDKFLQRLDVITDLFPFTSFKEARRQKLLQVNGEALSASGTPREELEMPL
ncbi:MAG: DUF3473 domain-containing protein [Calditrichaeota bacterium]|nr:MAG: DUF3473 domain-containing protein [Calditrichota bacterium]